MSPSTFQHDPPTKLQSFHILQDSHGEPVKFQLPKSTSLQSSSFFGGGGCRSVNVHPTQEAVVTHEQQQVQLCLFTPSSDPSTLALYCGGGDTMIHAFLYDKDDVIVSAKLLPLPSTSFSRDLRSHGTQAVVGVVLIVATIKTGLSVDSLVFSESSPRGPLELVESLRLTSSSSTERSTGLEGRAIRNMLSATMLVRGDSPCLVVASTFVADGANKSPAKQYHVCIQRFYLRKHKCPAFALHGGSPPENSHSIVIEDVGPVKSMAFGSLRSNAQCTLAVTTATELTLVDFDVLLGLKLVRTCSVTLSDCQSQLGPAVMISSMGCSDQIDKSSEYFGIACHPKSSNVELRESGEPLLVQRSDAKEIALRAVQKAHDRESKTDEFDPFHLKEKAAQPTSVLSALKNIGIATSKEKSGESSSNDLAHLIVVDVEHSLDRTNNEEPTVLSSVKALPSEVALFSTLEFLSLDSQHSPEAGAPTEGQGSTLLVFGFPKSNLKLAVIDLSSPNNKGFVHMVELDKILPKEFLEAVRDVNVRAIVLDVLPHHRHRNDHEIRISALLSFQSGEQEAVPAPINLDLEESSPVALLTLLYSLEGDGPDGTEQPSPVLARHSILPAERALVEEVSPRRHRDLSIEGRLDKIERTFQRFVEDVSSRLDGIEFQMNETTSRMSKLEAILKEATEI